MKRKRNPPTLGRGDSSSYSFFFVVFTNGLAMLLDTAEQRAAVREVASAELIEKVNKGNYSPPLFVSLR